VRRTLERLGPIAPDDGLAMRFDADGDRVLFYDAGQEIPPDFIFLLLAEQLGFQPVLFDMRFSRTVRTRLDGRAVPYFISRSGRLYMVLAMRHTGAVLGAEVSGHYYWKEFGGMEAPELTMLRVYSIVQNSGHSLSELVAPYRTMVKRDDIKFSIRDDKHAASIIHLLKERFHDGTQKHEDGLTVEYPDWWFTIRQSNTEPLMRFTIEAKTNNLLDQKVEEVQELVNPVHARM
jgi:phosphomannomutase